MPSNREMRERIRSVGNITQVTHALETVSASRVRKAVQAVNGSRSYSEKAWKVLLHLARQPGRDNLHPLLQGRPFKGKSMLILVSGDRGLAGSYNMNVIRAGIEFEQSHARDVEYVAIGKKGREMLQRRRKKTIAEYTDLPVPPTYSDVSPIARTAIQEFLAENVDDVYIAYTQFHSMAHQDAVVEKILPITVDSNKKPGSDSANFAHKTNSVFIYEPDESGFIEEIVLKLLGVKIYQSILSSVACEFASRMMAMHNATENGKELLEVLHLDYNKARQNAITNELLDIAAGAEALQAAS